MAKMELISKSKEKYNVIMKVQDMQFADRLTLNVLQSRWAWEHPPNYRGPKL